MTTTMFVTEADVRDYLTLNAAASSGYSSALITSNIKAASAWIERATNRYFGDRPALTLTLTTQGVAAVDLPGFRSVTSVTKNNTALTANETYWLLPDAMATGLYTGISFRAFLPRPDGPNYLHFSDWFDRNLDSPLWPGNWAPNYGSLPNDLVVVGDAGYADADLPYDLRLAVKAQASLYTLGKDQTATGSLVTPDGNIVDLTGLARIVNEFVSTWRIGLGAVSVG